MNRKKLRIRRIKFCGGLMILALLCMGVLFENIKKSDAQEKEMDLLYPMLFRELVYEMQPFYAYVSRGVGISPLYEYASDHSGVEDIKSFYTAMMERENLLADKNVTDEVKQQEENIQVSESGPKNQNIFLVETDAFLYCGSGFISQIDFPKIYYFKKEENKSRVYSKEELQDFEFVLENFYTVDASTSSVALPDVKELLTVDCTVDKTLEGPHILIYHTHSQENFADSKPGDLETGIIGAGKRLAEILREEYGYSVYHHTGMYDIGNRDDAYAVAAPAIEQIMKKYPQIQVVIDLHRDGVANNRRLAEKIQGLSMAKFMFFNGLSYSNKKGELTYLPNEYQTENLALALKMGIVANEYYPGLVRPNYLNAYRYNMHYCNKSLLIELGAQTNTTEEIMNSCNPLAHILDMVLSGKETYQF